MLVPAGRDLGNRLRGAIAGRKVYVHLDCDVLSPGLLTTEYQIPQGLDYDDLQEAFEALSKCEVIGVEIAEYEDSGPDGRLNDPSRLLSAIHPLLAMFQAERSRILNNPGNASVAVEKPPT